MRVPVNHGVFTAPARLAAAPFLLLMLLALQTSVDGHLRPLNDDGPGVVRRL